MLTPPEAARTILEHVAPLPTERRPLKEALALVLPEDVVSPIVLPGWDTSAMDGYATRAADVAGATPERPVALTVVETVPAGRFPAKAVRAGEATRFFTGAPLPAGADSVIRPADTVPVVGCPHVRRGSPGNQNNIRPPGQGRPPGRVPLAARNGRGPPRLA